MCQHELHPPPPVDVQWQMQGQVRQRRSKRMKRSSMRYKLLGRTGVKVSQLCFGTMSFGGDADEATSAGLYKACRDAGINFFDCANTYSKGKAEEILGRFSKDHREE